MTFECAGRGELSELVPDHLLRNVNRDKLVSVMDGDRVADEVRGDHAGT